MHEHEHESLGRGRCQWGGSHPKAAGGVCDAQPRHAHSGCVTADSFEDDVDEFATVMYAHAPLTPCLQLNVGPCLSKILAGPSTTAQHSAATTVDTCKQICQTSREFGDAGPRRKTTRTKNSRCMPLVKRLFVHAQRHTPFCCKEPAPPARRHLLRTYISRAGTLQRFNVDESALLCRNWKATAALCSQKGLCAPKKDGSK